jgi:glutamate--cysteine ligase
MENSMVNFSSYFKPSETLKIGLECEAFLFRHQRLTYDEIIEILLTFLQKDDFTPIVENDNLLGLSGKKGEISLEPGGQLEYATPPVDRLQDLERYLSWYHDRLHHISQRLSFEAVFKGYDDLLYDVPWMPKERHQIMRHYMPKVGRLGLDMMQRTCTVQLNLDYINEQDMICKVRKASKLQPHLIERFSTSPHDGHACYRNYIWQHTDPARTGPLSFVEDPDMGFLRYTQYVLDIPMYFIQRNGHYVDMTGQFLLDTSYTWDDWVLHTNTVFPEIRLNPQIELRGVDSGPFDHQMDLAKFWIEALYG